MKQYAYCSYCGAAFPPEANWPRTCARCGNTTFRNPLPVSVALVPVKTGDTGTTGLLAVRRSIQPGAGELALPGGFITFGETWQEAAAREVLEETGLALNPDEIRELGVHSAPDGTLVVFGLASPRQEGALPPFDPNVEACERLVLSEPVEMAFGLHTQMVRRFFRA